MYVEYVNYIHWRGVRPTRQQECLWYDINLHLMVRFEFWKFEKSGVPFYCQYSQLHADTEWQYLLTVLSMGQIDMFKNHSYSIGILDTI